MGSQDGCWADRRNGGDSVIENAVVTAVGPNGCDLALEAALFELRFGRTVAYRLVWLWIALEIIDAGWEDAC